MLPEGCFLLHPGPPKSPAPEKFRRRDHIDKGLREEITQLADGLKPWPLFLTGEAGSGKTCAGLCMYDHFGGWYLPLPDLASLIIDAQLGRLTWSSGYARTVKDLRKDWNDANLIVLDEIGSRSQVSDHHYETLKRALDDCEGRPLVLISNHDLETLERIYDDRIASRIAAGTIVQLNGDRRLQRALASRR